MARKIQKPARSPEETEDDNESIDEWEVRSSRPEDLYPRPGDYWTIERARDLLRAKGQARIQHKLAAKAIIYLDQQFPGRRDAIPEIMPLAIDIGTGLGFSSDMLLDAGHLVVGVDMLPWMLEIAMERHDLQNVKNAGLYHPVNATTEYLPFRQSTFPIAFSVSALQWIRTQTDRNKVATEIHRILPEGGILSFHLFPRSSDEAMALGTAIKDQGFQGGLTIENAENPRKRRIFLVMERKKT